MPKKIALAAIVAALIGLYTELMLTSLGLPGWKYYIKDLFTSLNLGYLGVENRFDEINYINLFFYALLLTGGSLYLLSSKETRLVRYVISMIFLSKCIRVFFMVIYMPFSVKWMIQGWNSAIMLIYLAWHLLWVWLCWKALKYFRDTKEIAVIKKQYGDLEQDIISESSRWQRLFNLIADSVTFVVILFPILESFVHIDAVREFLTPMGDTLGARLVLYFIVVIIQIIYYMFFEGLLQATPGKMLTETRVVTDTGEKPSFSRMFLRTVSRFVPFESLSVLFSRGWHDDWSETYVVREKREGVNGGWYFFIFPVFLFIGLFGYLGMESYKKHKIEQREEERFEERKERIEGTLGKLTTDHVITISKGHGDQIFMKPEKIGKDAITFIYTSGGYASGPVDAQREVEAIFVEEAELLERVTLTRKELSEGILKQYDPKVSNEYSYKGTADLLQDGNSYYIIDIVQWFAPNIAIDNSYMSSSDGSEISINLKNFGWGAELIKVENKGDDIDWGQLPVTLRNDSEYTNNTQITGKGDGIDVIDADLYVRDTLGRIQVYNIKGEADEIGELKMTRIK